MRFLVDANLPTNVSEALQSDGHDIRDVRSVSPPLRDEDIYQQAKAEGRILLTRDLDFSNMLRYPPEETAGLVVCRVGDMTAGEIGALLRDFARAHAAEELTDALVILEPFRTRIRRTRPSAS